MHRSPPDLAAYATERLYFYKQGMRIAVYSSFVGTTKPVWTGVADDETLALLEVLGIEELSVAKKPGLRYNGADVST